MSSGGELVLVEVHVLALEIFSLSRFSRVAMAEKKAATATEAQSHQARNRKVFISPSSTGTFEFVFSPVVDEALFLRRLRLRPHIPPGDPEHAVLLVPD